MKAFISRSLGFANAKPDYFKATAVILSVLLLTACQETPDPDTSNEPAAETSTQTTPVTTNINVDDTGNNSVDEPQDQTDADSERDMSLAELEQNLEGTAPATNNAAAPNPEQAIKGAQITDVLYKNDMGDRLSVVFETSAAGLLNAVVTRPNRPKITLSAPEGQGNNPTYRSADGSIQLVSHAGGGTIDFIQNDTVTSFDAISAEAEVITE